MNFSRLFIYRPIATLLVSIALMLLGTVAFRFLPVAPLPQIDTPTVMVSAHLAGASAETMAATVATPLERAMGQIAGITELTSRSSQGSTRLVVQFDLDRDIDGAARDVQAAINAARTLLPSAMKTLPSYRKANPSDAPILMLALTSKTLNRGELYDVANSKLQQLIAQVEGVGQVSIFGGSLPAVRIDLNPERLNSYGVSLDTVRNVVSKATNNAPLGLIENEKTRWWIAADSQISKASDYRQLVITYKDGAPLMLKDVANVYDSLQDVYSSGYFNNVSSVSISITKQTGSNVLRTIEGVRKIMPTLNAMLPAETELTVAIDRSNSIKEALYDTEEALGIAIFLVVFVVFLFLRKPSALLIPAVSLPLSLLGTFAVMYVLGFSLNALSMMALIVSTGFVVDDAIVVLENIQRHVEEGMSPFEAALKGSREIGFTVISMTLSLIAVFIPLFLMEGVIGRLFREFAITLSAALMVSLFISLTLTPMLCSRLLKKESGEKENFFAWLLRVSLEGLTKGYMWTLHGVVRFKTLTLLFLIATIGANVYLYKIVDKGLFPDQDNGLVFGMVRCDLTTSFQTMNPRVIKITERLMQDPDVKYVLSSTGGSGFGSRNAGSFFIALKDLKDRKDSSAQIANRLSRAASDMEGTRLFLRAAQDFHIGGREANATYQYSIQCDDLTVLRSWAPKIYAALQTIPELTSVDSDAESGGVNAKIIIDREAATRYGINARDVTTFLNNAFSQRQIAPQYQMLNQYYSIMGLEKAYTENPRVLNDLFLIGKKGERIKLANFVKIQYEMAPLSVSHQGQMATTTISFNLADNASLEKARAAINEKIVSIGVPETIHLSLEGTAKSYEKLLGQIPWLIAAALATIYILLGVLYESWIHPITILSTLPSAGIGALLLMMATGTQLTVIAFIGILLLIGIVKKNAILMIDFAVEAQAKEGLDPESAILSACGKRFRPILMTTLAAFFGALPLIYQTGCNAALNRPLGIAICGGLAASQLLTLYTTPVVYVFLDRLGSKIKSSLFLSGKNSSH